MGCDALIEFGAADAVPRWVDLYRERLWVEPETRAPIDPTGDPWRQAFGDMSRLVDWTPMFHRALNEGGDQRGERWSRPAAAHGSAEPSPGHLPCVGQSCPTVQDSSTPRTPEKCRLTWGFGRAACRTRTDDLLITKTPPTPPQTR
jgi:hypothetical protein